MCQYLELLAGDNYMQVNRKLTKLVGLTAATYWSELLDVALHVKKKNTATNEGYWKIDRDYVEARTGICIEDQLMSDSLLSALDVLEVHPAERNMVGIKLDNYIKIITDDIVKPVDLKKMIKVSAEEKKKNNQAGKIAGIKHLISELDPELHAAYESWVESVYASGYFLTKAKIQMFENEINKYTNDKSVKLQIIAEGIQTGYDRADWVINKYETNSKKNTATKLASQKIATAVNTEISF